MLKTSCAWTLTSRTGWSLSNFLGGLEGRLQPIIYGLPAFQTGAGELIEELTRRNDGPVDDSEQGYSYAFLNITWGSTAPSSPRTSGS